MFSLSSLNPFNNFFNQTNPPPSSLVSISSTSSPQTETVKGDIAKRLGWSELDAVVISSEKYLEHLQEAIFTLYQQKKIPEGCCHFFEKQPLDIYQKIDLEKTVTAIQNLGAPVFLQKFHGEKDIKTLHAIAILLATMKLEKMENDFETFVADIFKLIEKSIESKDEWLAKMFIKNMSSEFFSIANDKKFKTLEFAIERNQWPIVKKLCEKGCDYQLAFLKAINAQNKGLISLFKGISETQKLLDPDNIQANEKLAITLGWQKKSGLDPEEYLVNLLNSMKNCYVFPTTLLSRKSFGELDIEGTIKQIEQLIKKGTTNKDSTKKTVDEMLASNDDSTKETPIPLLKELDEWITFYFHTQDRVNMNEDHISAFHQVFYALTSHPDAKNFKIGNFDKDVLDRYKIENKDVDFFRKYSVKRWRLFLKKATLMKKYDLIERYLNIGVMFSNVSKSKKTFKPYQVAYVKNDIKLFELLERKKVELIEGRELFLEAIWDYQENPDHFEKRKLAEKAMDLSWKDFGMQVVINDKEIAEIYKKVMEAKASQVSKVSDLIQFPEE